MRDMYKIIEANVPTNEHANAAATRVNLSDRLQ